MELPHWDFEGRQALGELVVHRDAADDLVWVFSRLFAAGFPIARMERVERYGGDDRRSMAANNASAFNFRRVEGSDRLSQHAFGLAVDLNPIQNPWVRDDAVLPAAGADFLDRGRGAPGMIERGGPVVRAFEAIGWEWGGEWARYRDYHHFQAP